MRLRHEFQASSVFLHHVSAVMRNGAEHVRTRRPRVHEAADSRSERCRRVTVVTSVTCDLKVFFVCREGGGRGEMEEVRGKKYDVLLNTYIY